MMSGQPLAVRELKKVFWHRIVATLPELCAATGRSPRTVMRYLKRVGYHSSYNDKGCYYTLDGIPEFDADGLWGSRGARFSRSGTLRETVRSLVQASGTGMTAAELAEKLQVPLASRLPEYVRAGEIERREYRGTVVYVSREAPEPARPGSAFAPGPHAAQPARADSVAALPGLR
jgi:hypothetical protein